MRFGRSATVVRIAIALWLSAGLAGAFAVSSIAAAKVRAAEDGGYPCVLEGAVTMHTGTTEFYVQDQSSGVRVSSDPYLLQDGVRVQVKGWMYLSDGGEFQVRARSVFHSAGGAPPIPRLVPLDAALRGDYQGELVSVGGTVLNVSFARDFDVISIQSGRSSVRIFYPANPRGRSVFEKIYPGMQVAASGISVPQTVEPEFDGYQVRLRAPTDLAIRQGVLRRHSSELGAGLAAFALAIAVFSIRTLSLRRRRVTPSDTPPRSLISPQVQ